jgi:excisionase family DNA binding protein
VTTEKPLMDALEQLCARAAETALREVLKISDATNRRLISIKEGAVRLGVCERQIYNMISRGELPVVTLGKRKLLDIRDLDTLADRNKNFTLDNR